jgi:Spy/CpxP family protein refolding chaperone
MKNLKTALIATTLLVTAVPLVAQAQSTYDDNQQLIAQIQTDKRAVVLEAMALDDAQVAAFTPIYDAYQAERKLLMQRGVDLINAYASNYDSMTDAAAKGLLKDWFKLQNDELALMEKYAKKFDKVLPTTKVLRFVQVENKLNTLLKLPGVANIPLAK